MLASTVDIHHLRSPRTCLALDYAAVTARATDRPPLPLPLGTLNCIQHVSRPEI